MVQETIEKKEGLLRKVEATAGTALGYIPVKSIVVLLLIIGLGLVAFDQTNASVAPALNASVNYSNVPGDLGFTALVYRTNGSMEIVRAGNLLLGLNELPSQSFKSISFSDLLPASVYSIQGNSISVSTAYGSLTQAPHTLTALANEPVLNITPAVSMDLFVAFGFDSAVAKPTGAKLWTNKTVSIPNYVNASKSYVCGYDFNFTLSPNYAWCYFASGNTTIVFEHWFEGGNVANKTIWWSEPMPLGVKDITYEDWVSVASSFQQTSFAGLTWYYASFPVSAGKTYSFKPTISLKANTAGKYHVFIKPLSEGFEQAISAGHYIYLDPWWNTTFSYKFQADQTFVLGSTLSSFQLPVNFSSTTQVAAQKMLANMTDVQIVNNSENTNYARYVEYGTNNTGNSVVWSLVDYLSNGNNTYYVYYGDNTTPASNAFSSPYSYASDPTVTYWQDFSETTGGAYSSALTPNYNISGNAGITQQAAVYGLGANLTEASTAVDTTLPISRYISGNSTWLIEWVFKVQGPLSAGGGGQYGLQYDTGGGYTGWPVGWVGGGTNSTSLLFTSYDTANRNCMVSEFAVGNWYHVVYRSYGASTPYTYECWVNNVMQHSGTFNGLGSTAGIMSLLDSAIAGQPVLVDSVLISNSSKSTDWIAARYQALLGNSWTFGAETPQGGGGGTVYPPYLVNVLTPATNQSWIKSMNFTVLAASNSTPFVNASLQYNASTQLNTSTITNNTAYYFNLTGVASGGYYITATVYTNASQSNTSYASYFNLDTVAPSSLAVAPANYSWNANASGLATFYYTPSDGYGAIKNATLFLNQSGSALVANVSNTSSITNASVNSLALTSGVANRSIVWLVNVCDEAGNCNNSTASYVHSDTAIPNNSIARPDDNAGNTNASGNGVTFYYVPSELVFGDLKNATLWHNASGTWAANVSNASNMVNASSNMINVTTGFADLTFIWNIYVCDEANWCAFSVANRTLNIDKSAPSVPQFVSPTLPEGTNAWVNWIYVNASFLEVNPDTCTLTFASANYTMTRVSNGSNYWYCWYNVTGLAAGNYTFNVTANDTAGNTATSANRNNNVSMSYVYQQAMNVNATLTTANTGSLLVPIFFDHASLVTAGKSQSNGNDIYFLNRSKTVALPYSYKGNTNKANTLAWVCVPQVNGSNYMQYGNNMTGPNVNQSNNCFTSALFHFNDTTSNSTANMTANTGSNGFNMTLNATGTTLSFASNATYGNQYGSALYQPNVTYERYGEVTNYSGVDLLGGNWTVVFWFNQTGAIPGGVDRGFLLKKGNVLSSNDFDNQYSAYVSRVTSFLNFSIGGDGINANNVSSNAAIAPNTSYFVAVRHSYAYLGMWLNNANVSAVVTTLNTTSRTEGLRILGGLAGNADYQLPAIMEELRFYQYYLSDNELRALYNSTATFSSESIVGAANNITLNSPAGNSLTSPVTNLNYTPDFNPTIDNCSLWSNVTGAWALTASNATNVTNASVNYITYSFPTEGVFSWGFGCYAGGLPYWSDNQTVFVGNFFSSAYDEVNGWRVPFNITMVNSTKTATFTSSNYTYLFNASNSIIPTGAVTVTAKASGYYDRSYNVTLSTASAVNLTVYLLPTNVSAGSLYVRFNVVSAFYSPITGALVEVNRTVGGSSVTVFSGTTDSSGIAATYLELGGSYLVRGSATGYISSSWDSLSPSTNDYYIMLFTSTTATTFQSTFENLYFEFEPNYGLLIGNKTLKFTIANLTDDAVLEFSCMSVMWNETHQLYYAETNYSNGTIFSYDLNTTDKNTGDNFTVTGCFRKTSWNTWNVSKTYSFAFANNVPASGDFYDSSLGAALMSFRSEDNNITFALLALVITALVTAYVMRLTPDRKASGAVALIVLAFFFATEWISWNIFLLSAITSVAIAYLTRGINL